MFNYITITIMNLFNVVTFGIIISSLITIGVFYYIDKDIKNRKDKGK